AGGLPFAQCDRPRQGRVRGGHWTPAARARRCRCDQAVVEESMNSPYALMFCPGVCKAVHRTNAMPAYIPATPRTREARTYKPAHTISPREPSAAISSENVENVVKPPRTPVARNSLSCWDKPLFMPRYSTSAPMANEPRTLTHNVATGYWVIQSLAVTAFTPCRKAEPSPPPRKTSKKSTRLNSSH